MKLNITDHVLSKLGFSEYWDDNGNSGSRILEFKNGEVFKISEQCQMDDGNEGYGGMCGQDPMYISNHYCFMGWYASPQIKDVGTIDLFFLSDIYYCIRKYYPECVDEFINKVRSNYMIKYINHLI